MESEAEDSLYFKIAEPVQVKAKDVADRWVDYVLNNDYLMEKIAQKLREVL